jgi:HAD superfamily hydrolase (TIGR01509 family)
MINRREKALNLDFTDFDGVAFDFDGTLVDSYHHHEQARFEAFTAHGYGDITMEQHRRGHLYGNTTHEIVGGLLKVAGKIPQDADVTVHPVVQSVVEHRNKLYMQAASKGLDAQKGVVAVVLAAAAHFSKKLAIVTTAQTSDVLPFLKRYKLESCFSPSRVITQETMEEFDLVSKPAPDGYVLALQRLSIVEPARLLVFEDTNGGVLAAKQAGTTVVAVGTSLSRADFYESAAEYHPDYFVASFMDITIGTKG